MTENQDYRHKRKDGLTEVDPIRLVREALGNIRFGGIQLTVHEGKLVQIEVTEKRRFT